VAVDPELLAAKAAGGDRDAQFGLGVQFGSGLGALRDPERAAHWYRLAADQNHALAQFNLGLMYANGDGVPRDEVESIAWLQKAAEQGDAGAQHSLGVRCQRATFGTHAVDIDESRIESYKWFCLAAAQGYRGSELACEGMNLKMTREQIVEGNRRAAAFKSPAVPSAGADPTRLAAA
jgi:TPR repeat protein